MNIEVYMSNDKTKFGGTLDGKRFDYSVEEFINLIGAFQMVVHKVKGIELKEEDQINSNMLEGSELKEVHEFGLTEEVDNPENQHASVEEVSKQLQKSSQVLLELNEEIEERMLELKNLNSEIKAIKEKED